MTIVIVQPLAKCSYLSCVFLASAASSSCVVAVVEDVSFSLSTKKQILLISSPFKFLDD